MPVPTERHGGCEIGQRLMSAEASLVVHIQLLWPLAFETSGALQFWLPYVMSSTLSPAFSRATF